MKIAYYCTGNIWKSGGGATVLKNILSKTQSTEHELHLFVSNSTELTDEIKSNFLIHSLKTPKGRLALELYDQIISPFVLMKGKFDRIICLNSIVPLMYPKRTDVYFQMRMFYFEELDSTSKKIKNFLGKMSIKKSKSVYVASLDHKSDLVKNLNSPSNKYKVVNLAFSKVCEAVDKPKRYSNNKYFVFISVIRPYKNLDRLVTAYLNSCSKYGEIFHDLYIIGSPTNYVGMNDYMAKIEEEIQNSKWSHKIHFLGAKSHSESMSYLTNSQALVFPTLFEGFGLPLLEAMALGVPTIVSNRNSLPEVGADTVRYFDPEDISQLESELACVYEGKYSEELVKNASERAKLFKWENTSNSILMDREYKV
jgi:glycosyltransferase involved in cell wall biosynthesis